MLFHTWAFVAFFLIVYAGFRLLRGTRAEMPWLLGASYLFYGAWNPLYLVLILYTTSVDYYAVTRMARSRRRGMWLALSVVNSLLVLGFFKYRHFAAENINLLLDWAGVPLAVPMVDELLPWLTADINSSLAAMGLHYTVPGLGELPVGISFFTFQSMSYTIDFYRGHCDREPSFIRYATFVSFFPQLVAGPIERSTNLLRQLGQVQPITRTDVADGLSLFLVGLFKKVALADYLAQYVDKVYAVPGNWHAPALVLATFAFSWQIYFDFSGYTDMARGLGRMMGFRLMLNFNNPYLADSLGDFWRRWHISLSTWFRDYVYIPMGGSRRSTWAIYRNMILTMVISGLWHGAEWGFVIWGLLHAAGRAATRGLEQTSLFRDRVPRPLKQALVFAFVTFAWIFFRARSWSKAWTIIERIFTSGWSDPQFPVLAMAMILAVWAYQHAYESRRGRGILELAPVRVAAAIAMAVYLATFIAPGAAQAFIYFQF